MRLTSLPSVKLIRGSALALVTGLLAACSSERSTAPSRVAASTTPEKTSGFTLSDPSKALYGVSDGTFSVTFSPGRDQSFSLGPNRLDIPANAICRLDGSGYGAAYWNSSCVSETQNVTLTVVIKDAASDHPRVDFSPAMRFNPTKSVQLFMYVPNATSTDARNWVMKYCDDLNLCVDESLKDRDLQSYVDRQANVVFRRVKHFSGYMVAENSEEAPQ